MPRPCVAQNRGLAHPKQIIDRAIGRPFIGGRPVDTPVLTCKHAHLGAEDVDKLGLTWNRKVTLRAGASGNKSPTLAQLTPPSVVFQTLRFL